VSEDGKAQDIAFVEYQPIEGAAAGAITARPPYMPPPIAGAVSVPLPGDVRYRGRRLLVLYFDLYNMPFFDEIRMYASAREYVTAKMTAADMVALMAFQNGRVVLEQDFTGDGRELGRALDGLEAEANDRENNGGLRFDNGGAFGDDDDTFNLFSTDRQLAALQTAVTGLGPLPELKTLVYFGSGLRLNGADNQAQLRATVNAAVRSNVTINPIDTRGLVAAPPLGDATQASPGGIGLFSGALAQSATLKQQQSQDTYYALATDTGGRAMFDNNDLGLGIVRAAQAVTGYYMIGYYTANTVADGRFRRVKISLTSGIAADLGYLPGYYAARTYAKFNAAEKERQLEEALRLEDPITDIPMAIEINYFQLDPAEVLRAGLGPHAGREVARPGPGGAARADIDVVAEIKDPYGVTIRNSKDLIRLQLDAAAASRVASRSIQYETGFTLLPGTYDIKVLMRDAATGRIGTFRTSFAVPNLERETERLPISTVVLTHQTAARGDALFNVRETIASDVGNPLVFGGQKLIPAVTRTFHAGQPLHVFLQAYEHGASEIRPLVAFVAFYRNGVKVLETEPAGITDAWTAASRGVPIRLTVSLAALEPGEYGCQVTVLDPDAGRAAFWRAPIVVVR